MTEFDYLRSLPDHADEQTIRGILHVFETEESDLMPLLDEALHRFPQDGRLYFFRGAYLASRGESSAAHADLLACTTLVPAFHAGWFMLGFLELMSERVEKARIAWTALDTLPPQDSLRLCANGLLLLVHDEFEHAARQLRLALEMNTLYPPLIGYIHAVLKAIDDAAPRSPGTSAEHHLLLSGYLSSMTRH
jgi:tetratricopeptide (TPR) repeat protein